MNGFCQCPRCGDHAYERLATYGHCVSCLYSDDFHHDSERSYHEALCAEKLLEDDGQKENDSESKNVESLAS